MWFGSQSAIKSLILYVAARININKIYEQISPAMFYKLDRTETKRNYNNENDLTIFYQKVELRTQRDLVQIFL